MFNIFKKKSDYSVVFNLGNDKHDYYELDNHERVFRAVDEADALAQFWRRSVECNRRYCLIVEVKKV